MMLTTARLMIRRFRPDDVDAMHTILSDPRAMRYWSTLPHTDRAESRSFVEATCNANPDMSDDFIIERDGQVIGKAGMWEVPEVGFLLHPDHWGLGLGREALTAILGDIFERRPALEAAIADVDPRNEASLRLLKGLGFHVTGHATATFTLGDEICDSTYLALPRTEWLVRSERSI